VSTPGGPQPPVQTGTGTFGSPPAGTVVGFNFGALGLGAGATASSTGYPWTTAKVRIWAANASPVEDFIISGNDTRSAMGAGALQMVAGSLSLRGGGVGPNANRAWLRLNLVPVPGAPALSPLMRGVTVAIMMAVPALAFAARRRRTA
jgi:hypothetical protein